jgi:hypothetical protein
MTGTAMRILAANATVFSVSLCWRCAIGNTSMVANGRATKKPAARGNLPDSQAATPMISAERTTLMTTATSTPLANTANWDIQYDFFGRSRPIKLICRGGCKELEPRGHLMPLRSGAALREPAHIVTVARNSLTGLPEKRDEPVPDSPRIGVVTRQFPSQELFLDEDPQHERADGNAR